MKWNYAAGNDDYHQLRTRICARQTSQARQIRQVLKSQYSCLGFGASGLKAKLPSIVHCPLSMVHGPCEAAGSLYGEWSYKADEQVLRHFMLHYSTESLLDFDFELYQPAAQGTRNTVLQKGR